MKVAVIGGGITGLVAARALEGAGNEVVLFESSDRVGGLIRTHRLAGALVEGGADWFITRDPGAVDLCRDLGLGEDLVQPAVSGAAIYRGGKLIPLPRGFTRGIPTSPWAAWRSGLVSIAGAFGAVADYYKPGPLEGDDVAIGTYLRERLGDRIVDGIVDPMIAASRSGSVDEISLAVGAPEVDAVARRSKSIMKALGANRDASQGSPFFGIGGGMERLVTALASSLGDIRTSTRVESLSATLDGWRIEADGTGSDFDGVVLAVPPFIASELLHSIAYQASLRLKEISFAPATVVALVYRAGDVEPPGDLSGCLVPSSQGRTITAGAWFSSKWPHARSGDGGHVVRCFIGDAVGDEAIDAVTKEVSEIMGIDAEPVAAEVLMSSDRALPVFRVGHAALVQGAERALSGLPPVALAGAGYKGSGIPDCITSALDAARTLAAS